MIIDNINIKKFYLCITDRPQIPTPNKRIEYIEIPGRNGTVTRFKGYEDVEITVSFNVLEDENVKNLLRRFKNHVDWCKEISFDDDRDVFYKVKSTEIGDIENEIEEYGLFEIKFICEPFQYFYSGQEERTINSGATLVNPWNTIARPYLTVSFPTNASKNSYIQINNIRLSKNNSNSGTFIIDTELGYISDTNGFNMIKYFDFDEMLRLDRGENKITGNFSSCKIIPRWCSI